MNFINTNDLTNDIIEVKLDKKDDLLDKLNDLIKSKKVKF